MEYVINFSTFLFVYLLTYVNIDIFEFCTYVHIIPNESYNLKCIISYINFVRRQIGFVFPQKY